MNNELHRCAARGNLVRVKQLVKGSAKIEEVDEDGNQDSPVPGNSKRPVGDCGIPSRV
jgi:hypothetical protein